MKSKERIVFEAFKLFCLKPYDQVTFADIEKVTNLSRGAILYHFKAKENIFYRVIENYVLSANSLLMIDKEKRGNLQLFISSLIENIRENKLQMKKWGIKNINLALLNIETSAFTFYPNMQEKANEWYNEQLEVWEEVLLNAVKNGEIKEHINVKSSANLLEKIYIGSSFLGITKLQGVDIYELQKDFENLYFLLTK